MDHVLLLLAQADVDKIAKQAKSWYVVAEAAMEKYWYISVPGGFVLCFVAAIAVARWKWSRM